jgi:hypothetical protein
MGCLNLDIAAHSILRGQYKPHVELLPDRADARKVTVLERNSAYFNMSACRYRLCMRGRFGLAAAERLRHAEL